MNANIREILLTQEAELLEIDLDCLEEQLETGDYDYQYAKSCKETIAAIRHKRQQAAAKQHQNKKETGEKSELPQIPLESLRRTPPRRKAPAALRPTKISAS